jgi:hypothetical protein
MLLLSLTTNVLAQDVLVVGVNKLALNELTVYFHKKLLIAKVNLLIQDQNVEESHENGEKKVSIAVGVKKY